MMKEEAHNLRAVIDVLQSKNKDYADKIEAYKGIHSTDQSEIKLLAGIYDSCL